MGACDFSTFVEEDTPVTGRKEAFRRTVEDAKWSHGHGGYSGTIAEKNSFVLIGEIQTLAGAKAWADKLMRDNDKRIEDKWGPAGCIDVVEPRGYLFFGWASS
jgi:hypothetical protein